MTNNNQTGKRRRSEAVERLYTAREMEPSVAWEPNEPSQTGAAGYQPNEVSQADGVGYQPNEAKVADVTGYQPNELLVAKQPTSTSPAVDVSQYTPNEPPQVTAPVISPYAPVLHEQPVPAALAAEYSSPVEETTPTKGAAPGEDYSAYYRRDSAAETDDVDEPAFAPPPKLHFHELYTEPDNPQQVSLPTAHGNVYTPRVATWSETDRRDALVAQGGLGYQVEAEQDKPKKRRRRRTMRRTLTALVALCVLGGGAYLFREPIMTLVGQLTGQSVQSEAPFEALTTPGPVRGYDAAPPVEISAPARAAIGALSGTVNMETYAVTDTGIIARNERPDGTYDFYLFSADEGRLLSYFEELGPGDMFPLSSGGFYVKQAPYLVGANGSAMIRTDDVAATLGQPVTLHPLYNGWSIVKTQDKTSANYINTNGQLLSTLWFARTFPFTGERTVAYVDTGNVADQESRYLLYVLNADGTMTKWKNAPDMTEVVTSACDVAYLTSGELFKLDNIETPLMTTDQVDIYLDCDAFVARDPESGKYGLFVHGDQHYDCEYDSIRPVECDIQWATQESTCAGGVATLHAVTGATYPQPLSHYFVLSRDGQQEYVALSTSSAYPVMLDGEFEPYEE